MDSPRPQGDSGFPRKYWIGVGVLLVLGIVISMSLTAPLRSPRLLIDPTYTAKARARVAKAQIDLLGAALDAFKSDVGRYPSTSEGLQSLREKPVGATGWNGPYLKRAVPPDPWGSPFNYRFNPRTQHYELISYGADKAAGGSGDDADLKNG